MAKTTAVAPRTRSALARAKKSLGAEELILKAIEHGTPIETMKELLSMKEKLDAEVARRAYFSSLADFQRECPLIKRRKAVQNKGKTAVLYHYAPLDDIIRQVKGLLEQHGFSFTIKSANLPDNKIESTCVVHHRLGHSESTSSVMPITTSEFMSPQQTYGVANSYSKRYAFCNALGILTSDEDTDGAMPGTKKPEVKEVKTVGKEQLDGMRDILHPGGEPIKDAVVVTVESPELIEEITALVKKLCPAFGDRAKFKQKDKDYVFALLRDCFGTKSWADMEKLPTQRLAEGRDKLSIVWDISQGK